MRAIELFLGGLRILYRKTIGFRPGDYQDYRYVQLFDQEANDYIDELLTSNNPCMVTKFGTIELGYLVNYEMTLRKRHSYKDAINYVRGRYPSLWSIKSLDFLCSNSGFFPKKKNLLKDFYAEYMKALPLIDVLGSYIYEEKVFRQKMGNAIRVNLNGYYYPFLFEKPWTRRLAGKRVLVVSPFVEEIEYQYQRREKLFEDPEVLPEFVLLTYKSVQSILGIKTEYATWFDALQKMKDDISKIDFDIALIGCGAYGMPLAAHVKSIGKQVVHLAGCTPLLFGVVGKRWEDLPLTAQYINQYWIHPFKKNVPQEASKVEGGCYW